MSHKPLVNGTVYEMDKGKPLVGGTIREIDHGKTMVGGTVYDIAFAEMVTITLTGSLSTYGNYVEHNGIKYGSVGTFEAAIGDTITVHAGTVPSSATIYLNGTRVSSALSSTTYSYTVKGNATINGTTNGSGMSASAQMYITEQ